MLVEASMASNLPCENYLKEKVRITKCQKTKTQKAHSELNQTSMMEFFIEIVNGFQPNAIFGQKAPSEMFEWVLNMPLKNPRFQLSINTPVKTF